MKTLSSVLENTNKNDSNMPGVTNNIWVYIHDRMKYETSYTLKEMHNTKVVYIYFTGSDIQKYFTIIEDSTIPW